MSSQIAGGYKSIDLIKSDEVEQIMKQRYITDTELRLVIHRGESTGEKLYLEGSDRFLTKGKFFFAMYYVEYTPTDGGYLVHTAYAHRSNIIEGE